MKELAIIEKMGACGDAIEWLRTQKSAREAWAACERGDWLLWLCGKLAGKPWSAKRKKLVLAACECARLALPYVKDPRVLACIETSEAWARGDATQEQVRDAYSAYSTYAAYAAYSAYSTYSTYAAYTAYVAYVADAAYVGGEAVYAARQCADIVRKHYPDPPRLVSRKARRSA